MGLETSTYIDGLVTTNPTATDVMSKGDDHIRLIKSTIKASFPDVDDAVATIHNGTSAPASKQTGTIWRDTTNSLWKFWNGSAWITLAVAFNTSNSVDVNAGTIDGVTIGGSVAPTVTNLGSVATCDLNGGTLDGMTIGASVAPTVTNIDINGGSVDAVARQNEDGEIMVKAKASSNMCINFSNELVDEWVRKEFDGQGMD